VAILPGKRALVVETHRRAATLTGTIGLQDSAMYQIHDSLGRVQTRLLRAGAVETEPIHLRSPAGSLVNGSMTIGQPLEGRVLDAVSPGAGRILLASNATVWGGQPGQLRLTEMEANGSVTTRLLRLPPLRVSRTFADSFVKVASSRMVTPVISPSGREMSPRVTDPVAFENEVRKQLRVPEYQPVKHAMLGRDGSLWLDYRIDGESWTVVVDNRIAMRVRIPADVWPRQASRTHVWGHKTDTNGLPIILRYRLVRRN
jgi:hypothetical protein